MNAAVQYLEAEKKADLERHLREQGYDVVVDPPGGYDLTATRPTDRVAIEIRARPALREAASHIEHLRQQARREGFDEFRLVVVNPPHAVAVEVTGLQNELFEHMLNNVPSELHAISSRTQLNRLVDLQIDALEVRPEAIHVSGTAVVEVTLADGFGSQRDAAAWETDFPLRFDAVLCPDLKISEVRALEIDTSSLSS